MRLSSKLILFFFSFLNIRQGFPSVLKWCQSKEIASAVKRKEGFYQYTIVISILDILDNRRGMCHFSLINQLGSFLLFFRTSTWRSRKSMPRCMTFSNIKWVKKIRSRKFRRPSWLLFLCLILFMYFLFFVFVWLIIFGKVPV